MSARCLPALSLPLALAACAPPIQTPDPLPPREIVTPQQWAQQCTDWDEWDKPAPPYRIHGSTYYVGTCGIAAILVAGDGGHILIDSGTETGAEPQIILSNKPRVGTEPSNLVPSKKPSDAHAGGLGPVT